MQINAVKHLNDTIRETEKMNLAMQEEIHKGHNNVMELVQFLRDAI